MSEHYEEIIAGESTWRFGPGARHEQVCERLHLRMLACLTNLPTTRLLAPRALVELSSGNLLRPDLTLVTSANSKPWLIAEVIDSHDHRTDTVVKKSIYEELRLPRLWMVDPRYDNVEIYHASPYGLSLKQILAGRDVLTEKLLPGFEISLVELFSET
jgi:Uma2 family endonuclease